MTTTITNPAELLAHAEALVKVQHDLHRFEGTKLARGDSAWGHLHNAILDIMIAYWTAHGSISPERLAIATLNGAYENGENLRYQLELIAKGELRIN
jgi:hypothetical protein